MAANTETFVVFTEEDQNRQSELRSLINVCDDEAQGAKLQAELIKLNKKEKTFTAQRGGNIADLFTKLHSLNITIAELFEGEQPLFPVKAAKAYAQEKGWTNKAAAPAGNGKSGKQGDREKRQPIFVGTFFTKDFPKFKVPKDGDGNPLVDPEFSFELFRKYGPTPNNDFANAIKAKGHQFIVEHACNDFKAWLAVEGETADRGRAAGLPNHPNFREFMAVLGVKTVPEQEAAYEEVAALLKKKRAAAK